MKKTHKFRDLKHFELKKSLETLPSGHFFFFKEKRDFH